jgi:phytol kinase
VLLLAGFLLLNELVARRWRPPAELSRKLAHVGSALLAAVSCLWLDHHWYVIIGIAFTVVLLLARRFLPLRSLNSRSERSWGELLFGLGVAVAALIADGTTSFVLAVLILGLSDTAAYLVGRRSPVRPLLLGRTVGGSTAFLITTFLIALPAGLVPAAVVAVACTLAELVSPRGTDNLTVPALAAVLISALA